eukprot:CAMPEP_0183787004 /NCGR_PEP_ID=MMETSP0739-20130205/67318_1 /TAXON_ID=385413 /ORGANISM="Thalassiosira miniscula, Strain CCMP1093" /LENGTH=287 /DNA_ID=CAMNT_0026031073 /DNA_START=1963 /DNA_END=2823 /DNA_ORIENTATION=+
MAPLLDVAIQILATSKTQQNSHCNPFGRNMLNLFESGAKVDVAFRINGSTIYAHKFILETNAPALARLCDGTDRLDRHVNIFGTSPDAFRHLLRYIYGGEVPEICDILQLGKEIIEIAYRFGQLSLKAELERIFVEYCVVDTKNCIDFIFFSDKQKCYLLKKHAIDYIVARSNDVLNSESSEMLKQSPTLMHEIMLAMTVKSTRKQKQTTHRWRRRRGGNKVSSKKKITRNDGKRGMVIGHHVSPLEPDLEKRCTVAGGQDLDADQVRREAKRILKAANESMGLHGW